jgi:hypothetical protein
MCLVSDAVSDVHMIIGVSDVKDPPPMPVNARLINSLLN